jgi:preprotein translocase subunit SecA
MHFDIRKQLLAYDNVMNQQREAIYAERADILTTPVEEMAAYGWDVIHGVVNGILDKYFPEGGETEGERAASKLRALFGQGAEGKIASVDTRLDMEGMREEILDGVKSRYDSKMAELDANSEVPIAGNIVRHLLLNTLDSSWREHLLGMDELRRGIGLRAIGQKDPLIEYQFESYNLFTDMMERVKSTFTEQIFRIRILTEKARPERQLTMEKQEFRTNAPAEARMPAKKVQKVGRNDPCPCGSGKKYKYCHGRGL